MASLNFLDKRFRGKAELMRIEDMVPILHQACTLSAGTED